MLIRTQKKSLSEHVSVLIYTVERNKNQDINTYILNGFYIIQENCYYKITNIYNALSTYENTGHPIW